MAGHEVTLTAVRGGQRQWVCSCGWESPVWLWTSPAAQAAGARHAAQPAGTP